MSPRHVGHIVLERTYTNDITFLAVMHFQGAYYYEVRWPNGTAVGGDANSGSFTWASDIHHPNLRSFTVGFPEDDDDTARLHLNTDFVLNLNAGPTLNLFDTEFRTGDADTDRYHLPNTEFSLGRDHVNVTLTNFKQPGEYEISAAILGTKTFDTVNVNVSRPLDGADITLSNLDPNTDINLLVSHTDTDLHPHAVFRLFETLPPLLDAVNDEADLVNATSGYVDIEVLENDVTDPANITATVVIIDDGAIGNATVIDGTIIRYEANDPLTTATDRVSYQIDAFRTRSETANVTVNIPGLAPRLHDIENRTIPEGDTLTITLNATDPNNATADLIFGISDEPEGMTITGNTISWEPAEAQGPGDHTFNVTVTDNTYSDSQLVTVTVTEVNQAPVFETNQTEYRAPIGVEFELDLNATDADLPAQTVSYQIESQTPEDNPAEINNQTGMITWTPDGYDPRLITVLAVDDFETPANSSITLNITVPNTPPTTTAASIRVNQSETRSINLAAAGHISDAEQSAGTLVVTINDTPAQTQGMASANGTTVTYTANATASGTDEISYTVTDGGGLSATGSIAVTIWTPNTPPTAESFVHNVTAVPEQPLEIPIASRISDDQQPADTLNVTIPSQPQKGSAFHESGTITYTARRDTSGNDTITYGVIDRGGLAATGTITVTIQPVTVPKPAPQNNTAPTAENFTHGTAAVPGQPLEIPIASRISDEQQPAETLNVTIPARPNQGNATYDNGTITYTADSGAVGNDTISYLVVDDAGLNATGLITVTISAQAPNTPPTAGGVIAMADTGETITINLAPHVDDDEDAAADLTVSITVQPTLGTASMTPGTQVIQYTAGQNAGTDTITYAVADSGGLSATGTINITISAVSTPAPNTPPTAQSFTHDIPAAQGRPLEIPITSRISDDAPLGDPPNVGIPSQPNQGTATYAGGTITYTANQGATGTDTIAYTVTDAGGLDATGTITVQIQPPRGTPGPVQPEPVQPEPGLGSTVQIRQCTR